MRPYRMDLRDQPCTKSGWALDLAQEWPISFENHYRHQSLLPVGSKLGDQDLLAPYPMQTQYTSEVCKRPSLIA